MIPSAIRMRGKRATEYLLARHGPARWALRGARRRPLILAYHNIVPDGVAGCGEGSLHLTRAAFAEQLDHLKSTHEIVALDALWEREDSGDGRPLAVITFDDAYRGAVTLGVAELVRRGLPATIFVAPAFVGGRSFWWDALADPARATLPTGVRDFALAHLAGSDAAVRGWAAHTGLALQELEWYATTSTEAELSAATRHPGITLGSHSWSHPNLVELDDATLHEELVRPLEWLRERFEAVVPWIAYPYGLSSPNVETAAREAGYRGAVRVTGGRIPVGFANRYAVPRLNIPAGISRDGFIIGVSGLRSGR